MRRTLALFLLLLITTPASALVSIVADGPQHGGSPPAFTAGVGDVQSGWEVYYGIIPYTAAYATATHNAFDFSCTGPGTGTVPFLATGFLNLTGAIAGCSGTITITRLYEQTRQNNCVTNTAPCDMTQQANGTLTFLQSGCPNTSVVTYCLLGSAAEFTVSILERSSHDVAQPVIVSGVFQRPISARGSYNTFFTNLASSLEHFQTGAASTNDTWFMYASTLQTFAATDGVTHTLQALYNGSSSTYKVDAGTATASGDPGSGSWDTSPFGSIGSVSNVFNGYIYQVGVYPGTLSTGVQTSIANNQCLNTGSSAYPSC